MLEELLLQELTAIDVENLTHKKIMDILTGYDYEKQKDNTNVSSSSSNQDSEISAAQSLKDRKVKYAMVFSYLNAVLATQTFGEDKKQILEIIAGKIGAIVRNKPAPLFSWISDPYADLKKFISTYDAKFNDTNYLARTSQNAFVLVFKLMDLALKVSGEEQKVIREAVKEILIELNAAYKGFRSVEEFMEVVSKLWNLHTDAKANTIAGDKIQKAEANKMTAEEQARAAAEQLEIAKEALKAAEERSQIAEQAVQKERENARIIEQNAKQSFVTSSQANGLNGNGYHDETGSVVSHTLTMRTYKSEKMEKGFIASNAVTDGQNMMKFAGWTLAKVTLLQNLCGEYKLQIYNEENGETKLPVLASENGKTRREFAGKQTKMSEKIFSYITSLIDETKTPTYVIQDLNKYHADLEVTKNLVNIIETTLFDDLDVLDKAPGFPVKLEKGEGFKFPVNASKEQIKMMYYKISMLCNIWSDRENNSLLPYNLAKGEEYGAMALAMETKYPFLEQKREGKLSELRGKTVVTNGMK